MTLPETLLGKEIQRRNIAINTITRYCSVEEGTSYHSRRYGRPKVSIAITSKDEKPSPPRPDAVLELAKLSIHIEERLQICFLYIGNLALPICN